MAMRVVTASFPTSLVVRRRPLMPRAKAHSTRPNPTPARRSYEDVARRELPPAGPGTVLPPDELGGSLARGMSLKFRVH